METYHELRAEGLPFSAQYQSDRPPVLDPGAGSLLDRPDGQAGAAAAAAAAASGVVIATAVPQSGGGAAAAAGAGAGAGAGSSSPNDLRELSGAFGRGSGGGLMAVS